MQSVYTYYAIIWSIYCLLSIEATEGWNIVLSQNGPVILGGTLTVIGDLFYNDETPIGGPYKYEWEDNLQPSHNYEIEDTLNTTVYWNIDFPHKTYSTGRYNVTLHAYERRVRMMFLKTWESIGNCTITIEVTSTVNGNISLIQSNKTLEDAYVSSTLETKLVADIRRGDYDYVMKNATSVLTYWFIDCKYYGFTSDMNFSYNFTDPNTSRDVEALTVISYAPLITTTVAPPTTTTPSTTTTVTPSTTTLAPNSTTRSGNITTSVAPITVPTTTITSTEATTITEVPVTLVPESNPQSKSNLNEFAFPYICKNSTIVPPDPNKTYGYFHRKIQIRAPIMNISIEGTNWIQPWDMLSLNVTCKGSGPFQKCLQFHRGEYNITGNETCSYVDHLNTCNFPIIHYFLEPSVYTILVILNNDVSKQIYPLTIHIYKVTTKPQLSVIVVPVSCTLVAIVLIIFGVSYYIQSRARFTVEVADFDFGQNNPEMEYKTFTERLRDSFNNAVRPGSKRISVRQPYYGSMSH